MDPVAPPPQSYIQQVMVSTAFLPNTGHPGITESRADAIVFSNDGISFYIHKDIILSRSRNWFSNLIPSPQSGDRLFVPYTEESPSPQQIPINGSQSPPAYLNEPRHRPEWDQTPFLLSFSVPEPSAILNIMLHIIYRKPCRQYGPTVKDIGQALQCLPRYGIDVASTAGSDVWEILMCYAPTDPFQVFAIGASHNMAVFCVTCSEYTIPFPSSSITEAQAILMGPIYLRRLLLLSTSRRQAIIRICSTPPPQHQLSAKCTRDSQLSIRKAWDSATGIIMTDHLPQNMSTEALTSVYRVLIQRTSCDLCQDLIRRRVNEMSSAWLAVKRTI
ncbi:hypothetical protein FRB95_006875 [Tulasnella sp. JGI-2019a]|nr:hypothetical protein FRB95_006875 [Tulasnella sp. JGI-2019a]